MKRLVYCIFIFIGVINGEITFSIQDLELLINETSTIVVGSTEPRLPVRVNVTSKHDDILSFNPTFFDTNSSPPWNLVVRGLSPGHDIVSLTADGQQIDLSKAFVRVTVEKSRVLTTVSVVVGWIYFVAWSISFYPQIYENYRRKSVIGLNIDFVGLNLIGFVLYSVFNCGLYWIPSVEAEYFEKNPKGLNPVQLNDIVFSVHAACVTLFTLSQFLIYERGGQTLSLVARILMVVFAVIIIVSFILPFVKVMGWLNFLYICSYIKLAITLIKYIPQAVMNYKRKSTIGWSIGNVLLDFTGGMLSMLQMIINADNYNDWASIFGDPTKFGLGLFSVLFDIFFMTQHYILYRHPRYMEIPGINSSATVSVSDNGQSEQTVGVSEHPDRSGDVSVNT
ncbi:lysosomal cystine transporter cystinosin isoform X2 [Rhodnius prolixus]|uniref:lysosomal cystine transporter cystinosin isoform X2 n=1 Tax=Rhodnius prolixus TaxID=13249 RepID=UPI003D18D7E0